MKLKETIPTQNGSNREHEENKTNSVIDRIVKESTELIKRLDKLSKALSSIGFEKKVGTKQYGLLKEQKAYMTCYLKVLEERLEDLRSRS